MKKRFIWVWAIVLLLAMPSAALAEAVRIVTASLPPYGYVKNGQITGLAHEIGLAVIREAGFEAEEKIGPITRGIKEMETGDSDMVIMIPGPDIERVASNVGCVLPVETVILGLRSRPLHTLDDVRGRKLATVRKAEYDSRISRDNGMILYPTEDYAHSLKMLLARRVDFVIGPRLGLFHSARELKLPRNVFGRPLGISLVNGCLFISNKVSDDKKRRLTEAAQRLQEDGTIDAILEKYYL